MIRTGFRRLAITLGFPISELVGGYVEFASTVYSDGAPWEGSIDAGLTFGITDNLQFDVGCNVGVTSAAPDVQPFIGVTYRY